jgi:4-carboxymuconolactone decarboxylase
MNNTNLKVVEEFLSHADSLGDAVLADVEALLGTVPFIYRYLRERPESFVLNSLGEYYACRPDSLDAKTAELVTIAAATASDSPNCLKVHLNAAMKAGATRDEILDTILLSCLIGRTRLLASSLRIFDDAMKGVEDPANGEIR